MPPGTNQIAEITIRDLYPGLSQEQVEEVEETLDRYVHLVLQIYERIRLDPEAYAQFKALTGSEQGIKLQDGSNPS